MGLPLQYLAPNPLLNRNDTGVVPYKFIEIIEKIFVLPEYDVTHLLINIHQESLNGNLLLFTQMLF